MVAISIIIPNYNHAKFLPKAIEHALQQNTAACEIIIIDDGSTDNSLAVIQEYTQKYPQITLLQNEKNMGVVYTLNRGLYAAKGTHITFAAADDWIEPIFLQRATELLQQYPQAGFVSGTSWVVYEADLEKQTPARSPLPIRNDGYINPQQAQHLLGTLDSWFMGNTVIYSTSCLIAEGGFNADLQSFCDNFMCRLLAVKYGCCFTTQRLATWTIRSQGFATAFSSDTARQKLVLNNARDLLNTKYTAYFPASLRHKINQRLNFNLARTLWNKQTALTDELNQHLQSSIRNNLQLLTLKTLLKLISFMPTQKQAAGRLCLFLFMRPFDLWQQVRIQASSRIN